MSTTGKVTVRRMAIVTVKGTLRVGRELQLRVW